MDSGNTENLNSNIDEQRLDSWKEIAFYLGRNVRTAQRWEKLESLPVHRHLHEKSGTVYAYKSELDVWLQSRRITDNLSDEIQAPVKSESNRKGISFRKAAITIFGIILILSGTVTFFTYWNKAFSENSDSIQIDKLNSKPVFQKPTENAEAYDSYLKGRYALNRGIPEQIELSIKLFETATQLDPNFALAYAGLAESYSTLCTKGLRPGAECFPKSEEAVRKALSLNNNLAEAHSVLGMVKFYWDWDWNSAEREFLQAIELHPELAAARHNYAHLLSVTGRHEQAIAEVKRAKELEPLSATITSDMGWIYYRARRFDDSINECRTVLEMEPNFKSAQRCITNSLKVSGQIEQARNEEINFLKLNGADVNLAKLNDSDPVRAMQNINEWQLRQLNILDAKNYIPPTTKANLYASLGKTDNALEWLEIAYKTHDMFLLQVGVNPIFDSLRRDSRFIDLTKRIGIPNSF